MGNVEEKKGEEIEAAKEDRNRERERERDRKSESIVRTKVSVLPNWVYQLK